MKQSSSIEDRKGELINERKKKGDENYKEEKELVREMKKKKVDPKGKSQIDVPRFSERGPEVQFHLSPNAPSGSHHKMTFPNKREEMKGNDALFPSKNPKKHLARTILLLPTILVQLMHFELSIQHQHIPLS